MRKPLTVCGLGVVLVTAVMTASLLSSGCCSHTAPPPPPPFVVETSVYSASGMKVRSDWLAQCEPSVNCNSGGLHNYNVRFTQPDGKNVQVSCDQVVYHAQSPDVAAKKAAVEAAAKGLSADELNELIMFESGVRRNQALDHEQRLKRLERDVPEVPGPHKD